MPSVGDTPEDEKKFEKTNAVYTRSCGFGNGRAVRRC
jgi:hypothetical protein